MKKNLYILGILATSAVAFSACQKEQSTNDVLSSEKLVTITFNAEKAGIDTKTAAVEGVSSVSYEWTDDDVNHMKLFKVSEDGEGKEVLTSVSNITVNKVSATNLTISAQVEPNATYTFRAVLAGSWTNDGTKPRVNNTQYPGLASYDTTADVLVSDDMEVVVGDSADATVATSALEMQFRRLVVANKMTLKNMTAGEIVNKIVITSTKNLTGYYATDTKAATGNGKVLTLNYNSSAPVPSNGQFPVYFTTIPEAGHVLTIEVTTDQFIYTKSFAEGKSIDFNLGQFTKFNFALPAGVANTALALPVEDDMTWGMTGGSDATVAMSAADLTVVQGTKKIYDSSAYAYKGSNGIKLGNSGNNGYIKTNSINLSSAFYIAIDARAYNVSHNPTLEIFVDDNNVYTSTVLQADYDTYYVNCPAATATSAVKVTTNSRGYIKNLRIGSGTYVAPPAINVTSSNPLEVANTSSSQTITYDIANPTSATLSASTDATWITNLNYATSGKVTFDVAAQADGDPARSGEITLSYTGASNVIVTVNQAAGAGAGPSLQYTLSPATGSDNGYATSEDIEVNGITWNVTGNTTLTPWRIGGKSLSSVDRALYSKTALNKSITSIDITHGAASSITVNSMTVIVSKNADFSSPVSTLTPSFVANGTVTVDRPDGKDWSNCYYKIVYNVTVSGTSNKFLAFSEAKFYGTN